MAWKVVLYPRNLVRGEDDVLQVLIVKGVKVQMSW